MADSFAIRDEALSRFTSFRGGAVTPRSVYNDENGFIQAFDSSSFFHRAVVAVGLTLNLPVISGVYSDSALYLLYFNGFADTTLTFLPAASNSINNLADAAPYVVTSNGHYSVIVLFSYLTKWYIQPVFNNRGILEVDGDAAEDVLVDTVANVASVSVGEKAGSVGSVIINRAAPDVNANLNRTSYGSLAGSSSQGSGAVAVGSSAGQATQGLNAVAVGYQAGRTAQGQEAVAIGVNAGFSNQEHNSIAIGSSAASTSQGDSAVAIGTRAGQLNQSTACVAIGHEAGKSGSGLGSISVGRAAGTITQGVGCIAIGDAAGMLQANQGAVALGLRAGPTLAQMGQSAIAIGELASAFPGAAAGGSNAICIGGGCATNAPPLNFEVCIGAACIAGQAVGGLNFGANMQSVVASASEGGGEALPATTAAYIPLTWNGQAYRIPVYLP